MGPPSTDHEEFLALVKAHERALLKICWAYGRSSHDRDDLLQEIVSRLWGAFGTYDRNRRFSTWMFRVALNVAIDFRRRQRRWGRETAPLDEDDAALAATGDEQLKQQQLRELRELLEQQTDADRAILLLALEGHSYREIGDVLGISESNAGTRLNRLKTSLRRTVREESRDNAEEKS